MKRNTPYSMGNDLYFIICDIRDRVFYQIYYKRPDEDEIEDVTHGLAKDEKTARAIADCIAHHESRQNEETFIYVKRE